MAINYPTSLDTFSNPSAGNATNNLTTPHATQHANANDALEAVEAKVGTGASTPVANRVLRGTGTGTSSWSQVAAGDYAAGSIVNADVSATADLAMTKLQPYEWLLYRSSAASNVTGDATAYTVVWDAEVYDGGNLITVSASSVAAPVTGKYHVSGAVQLQELAAGHTYGYVEIVTSNRTYRCDQQNVGATRDGFNVRSLHFASDVDMDAADTVSINVVVGGSTKVVDLVVGGSPLATYFSVHQVG